MKRVLSIVAFIAVASMAMGATTIQENTFSPSENGTLPGDLKLVNGFVSGTVMSLADAGVSTDHTNGDGYVLKCVNQTGYWGYVAPTTLYSTQENQQVSAWIYVDMSDAGSSEKSYAIFAAQPTACENRKGYMFCFGAVNSSWSGWTPTDRCPFILYRALTSTTWTQLYTASTYTISDGWHYCLVQVKDGLVSQFIDNTCIATVGNTVYPAGSYAIGMYTDAGTNFVIDNLKFESLVETPSGGPSAAMDWDALK